MAKILITGASSGIGRITAKKLDQSGNELIIVARSLDKLESLKSEINCDCSVFKADLSQVDDLKKLTETYSQIDTLIHCAGLGHTGETIDIGIDKNLETVELNCKATVYLNTFYAKQMKEKNSGVILNVSSVASFLPMPLFNTYAASKAFVTSFSNALSYELKNTKVKVLTYCPGGIKTEFHLKAGLDNNIVVDNDKFMISAEQAANDIIMLIKSRPQIYVPGFINRFLRFIIRLSPNSMVLASSEGVYKKYIGEK